MHMDISLGDGLGMSGWSLNRKVGSGQFKFLRALDIGVITGGSFSHCRRCAASRKSSHMHRGVGVKAGHSWH